MLQRLVGIGTAICGASAIAAVATVIEPAEDEIALAIATVFFYNIVAVLVFPPLGHLMGLSQDAFGLWAGTAINDTSSVVAAGYAYGREAGDHATIVKLTRATLILPIVGVLALLRARARHGAGGPRAVAAHRPVVHRLVSGRRAGQHRRHRARRLARRDRPARRRSSSASRWPRSACRRSSTKLLRTGARPLALGFVLWVAVALSSLAIQHATGG